MPKCEQFWPDEVSQGETGGLAQLGISVSLTESTALTQHLILRKFKLSDTALGISDRVVS